MTNRRPKIKREKEMFIGRRKEAILPILFKRLMHFPVPYLSVFKEFYKTPRSFAICLENL